MAYQFDFGVQVLCLNVMSNLHVFHLHLQSLIVLEVLEAVSPFENSLSESSRK